MNIVFCRIAWMEYYRGITENDIPYASGYVNEHGEGAEIYNFLPVPCPLDNNRLRCLGFVEHRDAPLNLDRIAGARIPANINELEDVLVVFCATVPPNVGMASGTYVVGWYKHAVAYRNCQKINNRYYYFSALPKDCVLLPVNMRIDPARKLSDRNRFHFGQSNVRYVYPEYNQSQATKRFIDNFIDWINNYNGVNLIP